MDDWAEMIIVGRDGRGGGAGGFATVQGVEGGRNGLVMVPDFENWIICNAWIESVVKRLKGFVSCDLKNKIYTHIYRVMFIS